MFSDKKGKKIDEWCVKIILNRRGKIKQNSLNVTQDNSKTFLNLMVNTIDLKDVIIVKCIFVYLVWNNDCMWQRDNKYLKKKFR